MRVRLTWNAVAGATGYKVYRLGTQYMEEVTTNITFDGTSAILTGQSTVSDEYYAVSAVNGAYEGLRTMALTKSRRRLSTATTPRPRSPAR